MHTGIILGQSIADALVVMLAQREKGIVKYGVPIEEANLSVEALLQHAREEMADGSVYLAALSNSFVNGYVTESNMLDWLQGRCNLLTVSRVNVFPFVHARLVAAR